jgi:serine protease Do
MIRFKHIAWGVLSFFLLETAICVAADIASEEKVIPLPVHELAQVLTEWWTRDGFAVERTAPGNEVIRLRVSKGDAARLFDLSPRSAIAARIRSAPSNDAALMANAEEKWWRYLSVYIDAPISEPAPVDRTIPTSVLSEIESGVCIHAVSDTDKENGDWFSGVIVDKAGLVISTAHGLAGDQRIVVTLYNGSKLQGKMIYRDTDQDLALIQIPEAPFEAISLTNGRNLLGMGEQVFSIGCVGDLQGTVTIGMINGPPRRVDEQPLWQVNMEIHPGNSGSPVFDQEGNLVALVKGRYRGTSTVGFLIPLETIIKFLKESSAP